MADRMAKEQHDLRAAYRLGAAAPLTADFVAQYSRPEARRVHRNLTEILARPATEDALRAMQDQERRHCDFVMATSAAGFATEGRDLQQGRRLYRYGHHLNAAWLLTKVCGFTSVLDDGYVTPAVLEARLRSHLRGLNAVGERLSNLYGIKSASYFPDDPDQTKFIQLALKRVNAVLRQMYGVEIKRANKREGGGTYRLAWDGTGRLFEIVDAANAAPAQAPDEPLTRIRITSHLKRQKFDPVSAFIDEVSLTLAKRATQGI